MDSEFIIRLGLCPHNGISYEVVCCLLGGADYNFALEQITSDAEYFMIEQGLPGRLANSEDLKEFASHPGFRDFVKMAEETFPIHALGKISYSTDDACPSDGEFAEIPALTTDGEIDICCMKSFSAGHYFLIVKNQ